MDFYAVFDRLPLWTIFILTAGLFLVAIESGFRLAQHRQRSREEKEAPAPVGAMVGSLLGLLAFMQAFTFGMAAARFEERRQALHAEANSIRTTYLRAGLLPEPIPTDSRKLLREYVEVRLSGGQGKNVNDAIAQSQEMHARLWSQAIAAGEKGKPPVSGLFIQSVNELMDLHSKRVLVGLRSRVPGIIWIVLYVLALLAMLALGYQGGLTITRRSVAVLMIVSAFASVLILIADLDRPGDGLFRTSQQSLIDVRIVMN